MLPSIFLNTWFDCHHSSLSTFLPPRTLLYSYVHFLAVVWRQVPSPSTNPFSSTIHLTSRCRSEKCLRQKTLWVSKVCLHCCLLLLSYLRQWWQMKENKIIVVVVMVRWWSRRVCHQQEQRPIDWQRHSQSPVRVSPCGQSVSVLITPLDSIIIICCLLCSSALCLTVLHFSLCLSLLLSIPFCHVSHTTLLGPVTCFTCLTSLSTLSVMWLSFDVTTWCISMWFDRSRCTPWDHHTVHARQQHHWIIQWICTHQNQVSESVSQWVSESVSELVSQSVSESVSEKWVSRGGVSRVIKGKNLVSDNTLLISLKLKSN